MTDITSALWQFWSQFQLDGAAIPAYQAGAVPDGAALPYITFTPAKGDVLASLPVTAFLWVRHDGANTAPAVALRTAFSAAVARAIPYGGVRIPLDVGFLMLDRGSGTFLSTMADESDKNVTAARVGYEIRYYTT